jgi:hypothetical protein
LPAASAEERLGVVELGRLGDVAHLLDHDHRRVLVDHLVDGDHRAHLHHDLDDLGGLHAHLVREVGDRDGLGNRHLEDLGLGGRGEGAAPSSSRWRPPARERQPSRPPEASPRVFIARRRAWSSTQADAGFAARLGPSCPCVLLAGLEHGRCSVPSLSSPRARRGAAALGFGASAFTSTSTGASASVASSSPFLRTTRFFFGASPSAGAGRRLGGRAAAASSAFFLVTRFALVSASAAWRAASSAWRLASTSRFFASSSLMIGRAGRPAWAARGDLGGLVDLHEGALLAHLDLDRARLAGRVGLLDLGGLLARERDLLLLFLVAVHLAQVVEQARLVLLGDRVVPAFFFTPAACSCSSRSVTGSLSSSANWVTFDLAICCGILRAAARPAAVP